MRRKLSAVLFVLTFLAGVSSAGLIVSPARSEILIENGKIHNGSYIIENDNDAEINVTITAKNWNNSPENAGIQTGDWLDIPVKSVTLQPRQKTEIKYTAKSLNYKGSLSAMVSFSFASPTARGINLMTSVPIYMTIAGSERIEFEIERISVENPKMYKENGITVLYTVKNSGNIPLRPSGRLKIIKGKKTLHEQAIGEQSPVYAGSNRVFMEKAAPLKKGKYVLNISLSALERTAEKNIQIRFNKYGEIFY